MERRKITDGVYWLGGIDWDRRIFDSLIPLPDGTSYNAYFLDGSEKKVLVDTVDPRVESEFFRQLENIPRIDFVISHHVEQDHSGAIPAVLERYTQAKVIASPKAKGMLIDHLHIADERIVTVEDGETLSLGDLTLKFIHTPWVHWPETMVTYIPERKFLLSCDFFGSHIATTDLFAVDEGRVYEAAKRYYAEIMMPFRRTIEKNLKKLEGLTINTIAPSHGPIYDWPDFILNAYRDWVSSPPKNLVVVPYISMHGSTKVLVDRLVSGLADRGVSVARFDLAVTDIGKLAIELVDAATIVIGSPTVLGGPHPSVVSATYLANALRPKAKFVSIIGSYGWGGKTIEVLSGMIPFLKVEVLDPVTCKGLPREKDLRAVDDLAAKIAQKHRDIGLFEVAGENDAGVPSATS